METEKGPKIIVHRLGCAEGRESERMETRQLPPIPLREDGDDTDFSPGWGKEMVAEL